MPFDPHSVEYTKAVRQAWRDRFENGEEKSNEETGDSSPPKNLRILITTLVLIILTGLVCYVCVK